jgi:hypothetical protein
MTSWRAFWGEVRSELEGAGYAPGSRRLYRSVLRGLYRSCRCAPAQLTRRDLERHLYRLTRRHRSASWVAMNLSVLRTVFDRIGGLQLVGARRGPRRPQRLPRFVSPSQAGALLGHAASPRDALPAERVPELLTSDCLPPFLVEQPVGYFRAWLRRLFRRRRAPPRSA